MSPMLRTALTHLGTAAGASMAVLLFTAGHSVDVYAIIDQFNTVVVETGRLIALLTPFVTGAYGVYRASTKNKLADIEQDKRIQGVVVSDPKLAGELGDKVQTSIQQLPLAAKTGTSSRMAFMG